ncbi:MAG TPA: hypothetical protein VIP82_20745 [Microbacterium sp.]|uniref:hypothetical protein n=1 Tax=Microbacterium sp. TaxID=51671 RepID=UPI002F95E800
MPIVFAAPLAAPSGSSGFQSLFMSWTGFDGSVWDLSDPRGAVPGMGPGVKGLHMPAMTVYKSETPLVPGVDLMGYRIGERSVYWPLVFAAKNVDDWEAKYAGFFDSVHPIRPGIWTVGAGDKARTLPLTGQFAGDYAFTRDPFGTGRALIGVELTAPRPLWRGKPIRKTFYAEADVDFIPDEPGDDYYPTPIATFAKAEIDNPGNEPAYLTWIVNGPQDTGLELGVDGAVIEVPFPVADGSVLKIDTDPAGQFATLDEVDVTSTLGFQIFGPVPSRGTSPLTITTSGTGSVTAELVPLHWRAF